MLSFFLVTNRSGQRYFVNLNLITSVGTYNDIGPDMGRAVIYFTDPDDSIVTNMSFDVVCDLIKGLQNAPK